MGCYFWRESGFSCGHDPFLNPAPPLCILKGCTPDAEMSARHRAAGAEAFKRGDMAAAVDEYTGG